MLRLYVWLQDKAQSLLRREEGQDMVEYALITAIVGFTIIAVVFLVLGKAFNTWVNALAGIITTGSTPPGT